jgi:hypothetical protein
MRLPKSEIVREFPGGRRVMKIARFVRAQVRVKCAGPKRWFCRVKRARICARYPRHMFFPNSRMAKSSGKRMVMPFVPHGRWQRCASWQLREHLNWTGVGTGLVITGLPGGFENWASGRVRYRPCASIQRHTERRFPCRHRFSPFTHRLLTVFHRFYRFLENRRRKKRGALDFNSSRVPLSGPPKHSQSQSNPV